MDDFDFGGYEDPTLFEDDLAEWETQQVFLDNEGGYDDEPDGYGAEDDAYEMADAF